MTSAPSFLDVCGLGRGDVVSIVGAGGKTSLMFRLAEESRKHGFVTCVSTTTKMLIPSREQCDAYNLAGGGFLDEPPQGAGIYVAGRPVTELKMQGLSERDLHKNSQLFDITLLEADGSAQKPLKGWLTSEPVIPSFTTHTIGVVDISVVGKIVDDDLVHRLDCFCNISGAQKGDVISTNHLRNMITHDMGLFFQAQGARTVFINKVESDQALSNAGELTDMLADYRVYAGSIKDNTIVSQKPRN